MLQIFHTVGSLARYFFHFVFLCVSLCVKEDEFAQAFTKHSATDDGRAQILCS